MPTLEAIVVNPPKETETYTFSKKDIERIVAEQLAKASASGNRTLVLDLTENEPQNYGSSYYLTDEQKAYFLSICKLDEGIVALKEEPKYDFVKVKLPRYDNESHVLDYYYINFPLSASYYYYVDENCIGFLGKADDYYQWTLQIIVYPMEQDDETILLVDGTFFRGHE